MGAPPPVPAGAAPAYAAPAAPAGPKLKGMFWKKAQVHENSIWMDVREVNAETLDLDLLTQMFQIKATRKKAETKGPKRDEKREPLSEKRIQAIGIGLKFLKLPPDKLVDAILAMDDAVLDGECVQGLRTIVPAEEEIREVREFLEETKATGTPAQQFVRSVGAIPRLTERLTCWNFVNQFSAELDAITTKLEHVNGAIADLMKNEHFKNVLAMMLNIGNRLNANTNRVAMGFTIEELPKLASTKSVDNNSSLLEYLVQQLTAKHPEWLSFVTDLQSTGPAKSVSMKDVHAAAGDLRQGLLSVTEQMEWVSANKSEFGETDRFVPYIKGFLEEAENKVAALQKQLATTQEALGKLCTYFGSDPSTFDEAEFFGSVHEFCGMVQTTHKQLKAREEKAAKQKRLAETRAKRQQSGPAGKSAGDEEPSPTKADG